MEIPWVERVEKCKIRNIKPGLNLNLKKILRVNISFFGGKVANIF